MVQQTTIHESKEGRVATDGDWWTGIPGGATGLGFTGPVCGEEGPGLARGGTLGLRCPPPLWVAMACDGCDA